MTVALVALFVGGILIYAGITGRSVTALLTGDNSVLQPNQPLDAGLANPQTKTGKAAAAGSSSGPAVPGSGNPGVGAQSGPGGSPYGGPAVS